MLQLSISCITTDELSDLRGQVKLLEDKNTKYMQENIEIQEVRFIGFYEVYSHKTGSTLLFITNLTC